MWELIIKAYRVLTGTGEVEFIPIRTLYLRATSYLRTLVVYPASTALVQAATVAINAALGEVFTLTATTNVAIAIAVPTNPPPAGLTQRLVLILTNGSGGAMGAVTLTAGAGGFRALAVTPPANANFIVLTFQWNTVASVWDEVSVSADTPV